jgi:hypothetical protein
MPIKRTKTKAEGPTPRERIIAVMRDAKRPIRSLEIWQRLAIEIGQHHPGYLHLKDVRREVRAMHNERKIEYYRATKGGRQIFWALANTPQMEIAEWGYQEQRARPPKKEPELPPDPMDDSMPMEPDDDYEGPPREHVDIIGGIADFGK